MNSKFRIETISYYPLFLTMILGIVISLYLSVSFKFSKPEFIFTGFILVIFWYLMHYFFSGKFIAEIDKSNNLKINWIKKPFLISKTNRIINIDKITKAYQPTNLSWAPDKYVIEIRGEKSFSFYDPIFRNNNELNNFKSVLNYYISMNENRKQNGLQQKI